MEIAAVIGLGNPGPRYAASRHNAGFMVVDALAARWRTPRFRRSGVSLVTRRAGATPLVLAKPQAFMNLSGEAVAALCRREKLEPAECLIVVDDVDLPLGELRLRVSGGPGSHNGMRSIVGEIGEGFPRLRLGIRGEAPWDDLAEYVLASFDDNEREQVEMMVSRAAECVERAVYAGLARAAARYNGAIQKPEE